MKTTEVLSKTILSVSQIYDYVINPYTGCQHGLQEARKGAYFDHMCHTITSQCKASGIECQIV